MSTGSIVSVNAGTPRSVIWKGRTYRTAFFKDPVPGGAVLEVDGLVGDHQADRTVHGGRDKAVYAYPLEHGGSWESELGTAIGPGAFGENLTTEGLLENALHIGDRLRVGEALLTVTQPRLPCVKMSIRFDRADMPSLFVRADRPGFYLRVDEPGHLEARMKITVEQRDPDTPTVLEVYQWLVGRRTDREAQSRAVSHPDLGAGARRDLERLLGNVPVPGHGSPERSTSTRRS